MALAVVLRKDWGTLCIARSWNTVGAQLSAVAAGCVNRICPCTKLGRRARSASVDHVYELGAAATKRTCAVTLSGVRTRPRAEVCGTVKNSLVNCGTQTGRPFVCAARLCWHNLGFGHTVQRNRAPCGLNTLHFCEDLRRREVEAFFAEPGDGQIFQTVEEASPGPSAGGPRYWQLF